MRAPALSFVAAIDEYKREAVLTDDDQQFLERLREARIKPSPHNKLLVERLVGAKQVAQRMVTLPKDNAQHAQHVKKIRDAIRLLRKDFRLDRPDLDAGPRALKRGLDWADDLYGGILSAISYAEVDIAFYLPEDAPFPHRSREASEQNLFMTLVSKAMKEIFGKPRHADVAELSSLGFETTTTVERVQSNYRGRTGQLTKK
jgi:hypothetical protein